MFKQSLACWVPVDFLSYFTRPDMYTKYFISLFLKRSKKVESWIEFSFLNWVSYSIYLKALEKRNELNIGFLVMLQANTKALITHQEFTRSSWYLSLFYWESVCCLIHLGSFLLFSAKSMYSLYSIIYHIDLILSLFFQFSSLFFLPSSFLCSFLESSENSP